MVRVVSLDLHEDLPVRSFPDISEVVLATLSLRPLRTRRTRGLLVAQNAPMREPWLVRPAPTRHRRPAPARPVLRARSHRSVPRARVPAGTDRWPTSTRRRNSVAIPECGCGAMHKAAANAARLGPTPIQRQCRHRGAGARPRCSPRPSGAATGRWVSSTWGTCTAWRFANMSGSPESISWHSKCSRGQH